MFRIRMNRLRAATAAALFSLTLAAPALADRDRWGDDDDHRRGVPVHRHDRRCDHDDRRGHYGRERWGHERGWRDDHGWRGERGWGRDRSWWDRGDRRHRGHEYGCRPCRRRWGSEDHFHRHLTQNHGVPYRAIPRVLISVDGGWMFGG